MTASEIRALTEESNIRLQEEARLKEEKEKKAREETHRWYVEEYIPERLGEMRAEMERIALKGGRTFSVDEGEEGCKLLKEYFDRDGYVTSLKTDYVPEYRASGDEYAYSHDAYNRYSLTISW